MSKKSDFQVMQEMSDKNLDIRMSSALIIVQSVKQGGLITMGVDDKTLRDVAINTENYYIALYVVDKKQFDQIKNGS